MAINLCFGYKVLMMQKKPDTRKRDTMQTSMPQRMHTSGIFINARNNNTIPGEWIE